jgi:hypothetical protein
MSYATTGSMTGCPVWLLYYCSLKIEHLIQRINPSSCEAIIEPRKGWYCQSWLLKDSVLRNVFIHRIKVRLMWKSKKWCGREKNDVYFAVSYTSCSMCISSDRITKLALMNDLKFKGQLLRGNFWISLFEHYLPQSRLVTNWMCDSGKWLEGAICYFQ